MSIVGSARERPNSPHVEATLTKRTYTRIFLVETDSKDDGPVAVANAPGIPLLFSRYVYKNEYDLYALMRNIHCERLSPGSTFWEVTCSFETPDESNSTHDRRSRQEHPQQHDHPLLQLPEVECTFAKFKQVVYFVYDLTTKELVPCKASNGQVFDPPPTRDASHLVLSITRNEAITAPHPRLSVDYMDSVNADFFWGLPPGTWKMQSITPHRHTKQLFNGTIYPYLRVAYKMEARPFWDTPLLDAGTYYKDSLRPDKAKRPFYDDAGHPVTGLLDGAGGKLADGAKPVFKTFRFYPWVPFAPLGLPQSFTEFA
jgi:hypothetical protein